MQLALTTAAPAADAAPALPYARTKRAPGGSPSRMVIIGCYAWFCIYLLRLTLPQYFRYAYAFLQRGRISEGSPIVIFCTAAAGFAAPSVIT